MLGGMDTVVARPARLDVLLAGGFAGAVVVGTLLATGAQTGRVQPLDVPGLVLLVVAAMVTVGLRRAAPSGALIGALVLVNAYLLAGYPYGPVLLCLVIAVFEVARQRALLASALTCGAAAVISSATILVRVLGEHHVTWLLAVAWTGWIVLPWSLGALVHVLDAARRRDREALISRAALEERMRLASEVHDIAGHGFALITMQAGVALLVFDEKPDQARRSLEAVRDTSATALADLRGMLDTFHPRASPPADPAGIAGLIEQVRAGGLPVDVAVDLPGALPELLAATVYRVVQEALTNVMVHAGPTTAKVAISEEDREVLVRVTDHGRGGSATEGRGLSGMRRRVEGLGGRLEAGARDHGFEVVARLPAGDLR